MLNWLLNKRGKLPQTHVATEAGITQQQYSHIERGLRRPSVKTAMNISKVLGFDWTIFFPTTDERKEV